MMGKPGSVKTDSCAMIHVSLCCLGDLCVQVKNSGVGGSAPQKAIFKTDS